VRTIRNGKHCSLVSENIDDYPEALREAQLMPIKNAIANELHEHISREDISMEELTAKKLTDIVFKAIRKKLIYVDTQKEV